jgi:hypothetical protein
MLPDMSCLSMVAGQRASRIDRCHVATSEVAFWHIAPLGLCITFVALERSGYGPRHQWMPWTNAVLNDGNASLIVLVSRVVKGLQ